MKQALQIKVSCETSGYGTLRKLGYPLPSNRTLTRRLRGLKFLPGTLTDVIGLLSMKAETMEDIEKDSVLFLHEMKVAQGYELDSDEDDVFGGQTLPARPDESAQHALVFMVGGFNQKWKQVMAYHFTESHVDGCVLKDYVPEVVRLCADISLWIRVVRFDMGALDRAMWREFGFSSHRYSSAIYSVPQHFLQGNELFFIADAAPNARGQLLNSGVFTLSEAAVCQHGLPSSEVKLEHVRGVVQYTTLALKGN